MRKKNYKTGGVIPKDGMYFLHKGETIVPAMPMSPMASPSFDAMREKFNKAKEKYFKLPGVKR